MRKQGFLLSFALAMLMTTTVTAAETISGNYNTAFGYIAGKNPSEGEKVSAFGAGAYGRGSGARRCDFFGAASGAFSSGLIDCVGIGYKSFRDASNMKECVGLGKGAFENTNALNYATWINGQFYAAPGTFWLKSDKNTEDDKAPIRYANDCLYLNAKNVYLSDGTELGERMASVTGYSYYVSDSAGNDENAGTSEKAAFKTLTRAYEVAKSGDTIAVLRGTYAYPCGLATNKYSTFDSVGSLAKKVTFVGVDGADFTRITSGMNPPVETHATYGSDGRIVGSTDAWTTFRGFTFNYIAENIVSIKSSPGYVFVKFENCIFDGLHASVKDAMGYGYFGIFTDCWLKSCVIKNCTFESLSTASSSVQPSLGLAGYVFSACLVEDSLISYHAPSTTSGGYYPVGLSYCGTFYNSFVKATGQTSFIQYPRAGNNNSNFGVKNGLIDTTVLLEDVMLPNGYSRQPYMTGCLVGADGMTTNATYFSSVMITNYSALVASFSTSDDFERRPVGYNRLHPEWREWRFYGYESNKDRVARDTVVSEVFRSLSESGQLSEQSSSNLAARASSFSVDASRRQSLTRHLTDEGYAAPFADEWILSYPVQETQGIDEVEMDYAPNSAWKVTLGSGDDTAYCRWQYIPGSGEGWIDWGDGTRMTGITNSITEYVSHRYDSSGGSNRVYTIVLSDNFYWFSPLANDKSNYGRVLGDFVVSSLLRWGDSVESAEYSFGDREFNVGCYNLKGPLPEWGLSLKNINGAFYQCTNLDGQLPRDWWNIADIGDYAFYGTKLSGEIPSSWGDIVSVGSHSFKEMKVPESLDFRAIENIGESAFDGCFFGNTPLQFTCLTNIGDNAFANCTSLTSVAISGTRCRRIGTNVFSQCKGLKSFSCMSPRLKIEDTSFDGCSALASFSCDEDAIRSVGTSAFRNCSNLVSFAWGESIEEIKDSAFNGCKSLSSIPDTFGNVKNIGSYAFNDCSSLKSIPSDWGNITSIGNNAFNDCSSLKSIPSDWGNITYIGGNAFRNCSIVEIPKSWSCVIEFGYSAFRNCPIKEIPESWGNIKVIGCATFQDCRFLSSLPSSWGQMSNISRHAFRNCVSLTSVPSDWGNIKVINIGAFRGCSNLSSIPLSWGKVEAINSYAFYGCISLKRIPESWGSVWLLAWCAFGGCPIENRIDFPSGSAGEWFYPDAWNASYDNDYYDQD